MTYFVCAVKATRSPKIVSKNMDLEKAVDRATCLGIIHSVLEAAGLAAVGVSFMVIQQSKENLSKVKSMEIGIPQDVGVEVVWQVNGV